MIKAIEITNFQGFAGHHAIRLAPITLVLGANATGKSTVGRVLKLLAQSPRGILEFSGKNTDLVSFEKAIFGQLLDESTPNELSISVTVPLRAEDFATSSSSAGDDEEDFEDTYWETYLDKFQEFFSTRQIKYLAECVQTSMYFGQKSLPGDSQKPSHTLMTGFQYVEPRTGEKLKCAFGLTGDERFLSKDDSEQIVLMANSADDEQQAIKKFSEAMQTMLVKVKDLESHTLPWTEEFSETQNVGWLALLRQLPKEVVSRGFVMSTLAVPQDDSPETVNWTFLGGLLEAAAVARQAALGSIYEVSGVRDFELRATRLTEAEGGVVVRPASDLRDEALRQASDALRKLTNGRYSVHKENVRTSTPTKSINTEETFVVDNLTNARVSFSNVGAGLGQLLPILEGLFSFPRGKTLLIEQPELHLHPKAQADLATLFVDAIEGGTVEQVILETHSEAMLLRIQRLVRERRLKSTDVAIVVTQEAPLSEDEPNASRGNMIYNIDLTPGGELEEPMLLSFAGVRLDEFL